MNEEELLERIEKLENQLEEKIQNKELVECETCDFIFEYVPRIRFCAMKAEKQNNKKIQT